MLPKRHCLMLDEESEDNKSDSDSEGQCCEGEEDGGCHWFGEAQSLRSNSGSLAMFDAILRASLEKVNSHTSHIGGSSHTDNNRRCNIDTETPTHRDEHNPNNRSPAKVSPQLRSGLGDGGGGPCASRVLHTQAA